MITFKNEMDAENSSLVKLEKDGQTWSVTEKELERLFEDIIDNRPEYVEKLIEEVTENLESEIEYLNDQIRELENDLEEYLD